MNREYAQIESSDSILLVLNKYKNTKGLILDIRGYPQGDYWQSFSFLCEFLLPQKGSAFYDNYVDISQPGMFRKNDYINSFGKEDNSNYYKGAVAILVNEYTISAAEIMAMLCRLHPCSSIIGTPTRGAAGTIMYIPLSSGNATRITGTGCYNKNGYCTFPNGVILDKEIQVTSEGIREGRDEKALFSVIFL